MLDQVDSVKAVGMKTGRRGHLAEERHAYLFEARGIGRYVLASGKLRDAAGASELVSGLTEGDAALIHTVINALGLSDDSGLVFSRCAGGAFCLHHHDQPTLQRIADAFRIAAMSTRPGLEMSDAWGEGDDDPAALEDAYKNISGIRENGVVGLLPVAGPAHEFSPLTGLPAIWRKIYTDGDGDAEEFLGDPVTTRQRQVADALGGGDKNKYGRTGIAEQRFLPREEKSDNGKRYVFPRNLDPTPDTPNNPSFPFEGEDRRVAMVHADLSGLGQIFRAASSKLTDMSGVRDLSDRIGESIEAALQSAMGPVLGASKRHRKHDAKLAIVPARPILFGGDDITVLVRADLAFRFATDLLKAIEMKTQAAFAEICGDERFSGLKDKLPSHLSACAGLAIARSGQPFLFMNALAEDLCSFAKRAVKPERSAPYPSALAFHVVSSTVQERYEEAVLPADLTGVERLRLTANPYWLKSDDRPENTVSPEALLCLAERLSTMRGRSGLFQLRSDVFVSRAAAQRTWARWRKVAGKRDKSALDALDKALKACRIGEPEKLPFHDNATPLFDALELIDLGTVKPAPETLSGPEPADAG